MSRIPVTLQRLIIRRFDRRWADAGPEQTFSAVRDRLISPNSRSARRFAETFAHDEGIEDTRDHRDPVQQALELGQSLLRFGDGEAKVLVGKPIWQVQSPSLQVRRELLDVFRRALESPLCRVGVPRQATLPERDFFAQEKSRMWMKLRGLVGLSRRFCVVPPSFFDAMIFRDGAADPSSVWQAAERVVLVTNDRVADLVEGRGTFGGREVLRVSVPEREAVSAAGSITDGVREHYRRRGLQEAEVPVLIAAGVAGKIVFGRLFDHFRTYDLGHYLGPKHPDGRRGGAWRP